MKYRKKPVIIEAEQFTEDMAAGCHPLPAGVVMRSRYKAGDGTLIGHRHVIYTPEGYHIVNIGDFVITDVQGEQFSCKPDIFAATYEAVEATQPAPGLDEKALRHAIARGFCARHEPGHLRDGSPYPCGRCCADAEQLLASLPSPATAGETPTCTCGHTHAAGDDGEDVGCVTCACDTFSVAAPPLRDASLAAIRKSLASLKASLNPLDHGLLADVSQRIEEAFAAPVPEDVDRAIGDLILAIGSQNREAFQSAKAALRSLYAASTSAPVPPAEVEAEDDTVNRMIFELEAYARSEASKEVGAMSVVQFALRLALRIGRKQGATPTSPNTPAPPPAEVEAAVDEFEWATGQVDQSPQPFDTEEARQSFEQKVAAKEAARAALLALTVPSAPNGDGVQRCPICDGRGVVAYPPNTPSTQREFTSSSTGPWPCPLCKGTMIIPCALPSAGADRGRADTHRPVVLVDGLPRFQKNALVDRLYEEARKRGFGLNELCETGVGSIGEWRELAQLIGYSLRGYYELNYVCDDDAELDRIDALAAAALPSRSPETAGPQEGGE